MPFFLSGVAALIVLVVLVRAIASADTRTLVRAVRYAVGVALIGAGGVLLLAERFGLALPLIAAGLSALAVGRIGPFDLGGRGGRSPGTKSTVRSAFVEMTLDHDSGDMSGIVLGGSRAGSRLDDMDGEALLAFRRELAADPQSLALLEVYLDRRIPGWREDVERDEASRSGGAPDARPMTDEEAYQILGLLPGAGKAEIRAAHRRLMMKVHPDQGGSTFLAAKINEAKDWLLGKHR